MNWDAMTTTCNLEYEDEVHLVTDEPSASTRQIGYTICMNHRVVWHMLHEQLLHVIHREYAIRQADFPAECSFLSDTYIGIIHNPCHILFCSHMMCASCMKQYLTAETPTYVMKTIHKSPFSNDTSSSLQ